jgi:hypothetical protein
METEEKNGEVIKSQTIGTKLTSVNIDLELHNQAKQHNISLRDAVEFGIKFKIADKDGWDYPNNNLQNNLGKVIHHRNVLLKEIEALREQLSKVEDEKDGK